MIISQAIKGQIIFCIIFFNFISVSSFSQSVLLISSNTNVYNTYQEQKVVLLKLDEDTWVNYKGKYGGFIKISNFFGKDEYYPNGIIEGYVNINSVLDTSTRKEYKSYVLPNQQQDSSINNKQNARQPDVNPEKYDIDRYYLGMLEKEAKSVNRNSINLLDHNYEIKLHYNSINVLAKIEICGKHEDALAVEASIKNQIDQLIILLISNNGKPNKSANYPSFLELEDGKVTNVAIWDLPGKSIFVGIGETNDLYYPNVTFIKK